MFLLRDSNTCTNHTKHKNPTHDKRKKKKYVIDSSQLTHLNGVPLH